jgi:transcriptional regulator GlxA family with amidase domain
MFVLIEEYLWKKIQQLKETIHPVDKIGELILKNPQRFSLDWFAKEACLSTSQLERRFGQQIGVPPKFYARICRFYQAYLLKQRNPGLSWLDIAWESGYNDYHPINSFRKTMLRLNNIYRLIPISNTIKSCRFFTTKVLYVFLSFTKE